MDPRLEETDITLWFGAFVAAHEARCPRSDWPSDRDTRREFFGLWRRELRAARVTGPLANHASQRLAANPPERLSHHLPALLRLVSEVRREQDAAAGRHHDRATAEAASQGCPHCGGGGLASVRREDLGRSVAAYCDCPLGRWIRDRHAGTRDIQARFLTLEAGPGLTTEAEDRIVEEHWDSLDEWLRQDWYEWARRTRPSLAGLADSRPDSHWTRVLRSAAVRSAWEAGHDLEPEEPRFSAPAAAPAKPPGIGQRVDEIDKDRLAEQEQRRAQADRWLAERQPAWKSSEPADANR